MSALPAIGATTALSNTPLVMQLGAPQQPAQVPAGSGFGDILAAGMKHVEGKLSTADDMVRQFALDDTIPVHKVSYALEEARLTVELAMQVRTRLVEAYRELMNMQL